MTKEEILKCKALSAFWKSAAKNKSGIAFKGKQVKSGGPVQSSALHLWSVYPAKVIPDTLNEKTNSHERDEVMSYNVGDSNYAEKKIQPWDIWEEYNLNPWDADIIKRVLRNKKSQSKQLDYEKIIHLCKKRISQLEG